MLRKISHFPTTYPAKALAVLFSQDKQLYPQRILRYVGLLTFVGFSLRLLIAQLFLGGLDREYQGDEGDYVHLALTVVEGLGFVDKIGNPTTFRTPGLPLMVAFPVSFMGPNVVGIRIFMCLIESLLIPALYFLAHSASGSQKIGLIASAVGVLFPTWVIPSGAVLTDIPAAVLLTLTAWALIEGYRRQSLLWLALAGTFWGIGTLIRPVGLIYGPAIVLWLLFIMPGWKRRLITVAAVTLPFICLLAPWTIRNTRVHGTFVLISTQGGTELYNANHPPGAAKRYSKDQYPNENEATLSNMCQADAIRFIRENPWRFSKLCLIRFIELWKVYSPRVPFSSNLAVIASFGLAIPFFLIQAIRRGWQRGPELLFLFIILGQTGLHMVYTSVVRYRIPIEPLIVIMAIMGFFWTVGRFRDEYGEE